MGNRFPASLLILVQMRCSQPEFHEGRARPAPGSLPLGHLTGTARFPSLWKCCALDATCRAILLKEDLERVTKVRIHCFWVDTRRRLHRLNLGNTVLLRKGLEVGVGLSEALAVISEVFCMGNYSHLDIRKPFGTSSHSFVCSPLVFSPEMLTKFKKWPSTLAGH